MADSGDRDFSSLKPTKRKFSEEPSPEPELAVKKPLFSMKPSNGVRPKPFGGVKISMSSSGLNGEKKNGVIKSNVFSKPAPIKMSLNQKPKEPTNSLLPKKSNALAQAFGDDDESDEEEMPFEAKMRMKNIGRQTPTASGPNSFGKGKLGFCDRRALIKKEMEMTGPVAPVASPQ